MLALLLVSGCKTGLVITRSLVIDVRPDPSSINKGICAPFCDSHRSADEALAWCEQAQPDEALQRRLDQDRWLVVCAFRSAS